MTEEIEKSEQEETATSDSSARDKSETTELIDKADAAAERMEKAVKRQEAANIKTEQLMAKARLSGVSEGGMYKKKAEETDEDYANKIQSGDYDPFEDETH